MPASLLLAAAFAVTGAQAPTFQVQNSGKKGYYTASVTVPVFTGSPVKTFATQQLKTLANQGLQAWLKEANPTAAKPAQEYFYQAKPTVAIATDDLVSVSFMVGSFTGGAHPMSDYDAHTFGMVGGKPAKLTAASLFRKGVDVQGLISRTVMGKLMHNERAAWVQSGEVRELTADQIESFVITPASITYLFGPYEMGPYVVGTFEVKIPFSELAGELDPNGPLKSLLNPIGSTCYTTPMAWFTADAIAFFADLEQHNDREWFEANKKRYETAVKKPMLEFAAEMIERMRGIDPEITMLPRNAVFRIHRDTRFSKDKAPYKTNAGLVVTRGEKHNPGVPGLYFHFDAQRMAIASGLYFIDPAQLRALRTYLASNLDEFQSLLDDPAWKAAFGEMVGERNKVLPPELKEAAAKQPLLFNKQFYYWSEHPAETITREDLPEFVMEKIHAAQPMNAFLMRGVSG